MLTRLPMKTHIQNMEPVLTGEFGSIEDSIYYKYWTGGNGGYYSSTYIGKKKCKHLTL